MLLNQKQSLSNQLDSQTSKIAEELSDPDPNLLFSLPFQDGVLQLFSTSTQTSVDFSFSNQDYETEGTVHIPEDLIQSLSPSALVSRVLEEIKGVWYECEYRNREESHASIH